MPFDTLDTSHMESTNNVQFHPSNTARTSTLDPSLDATTLNGTGPSRTAGIFTGFAGAFVGSCWASAGMCALRWAPTIALAAASFTAGARWGQEDGPTGVRSAVDTATTLLKFDAGFVIGAATVAVIASGMGTAMAGCAVARAYSAVPAVE